MSEKEGAGLLLIMMEVEPEYEEEFNRWYWEEHVPERLTVPGFISARRFLAVEGEPKYLALYEVESAEVLQSDDYKGSPCQRHSVDQPDATALHLHAQHLHRTLRTEAGRLSVLRTFPAGTVPPGPRRLLGAGMVRDGRRPERFPGARLALRQGAGARHRLVA